MSPPDQSGKSANVRTAIDTLAWLTEDAFEGDPSHSLLANVRDLRDDEWTALLPGAGRTIADILEHVGWAKWMSVPRCGRQGCESYYQFPVIGIQ